MSSTNDNVHKGEHASGSTGRSAPEQIVAALCARMSADEAVLAAKGISAFNLEIAARALASRKGGVLLMRIPTQAGKPVEFRYEGYGS